MDGAYQIRWCGFPHKPDPQFSSGRTPTTHATLALFPTKHETACRISQAIRATDTTTVTFHTSRINNCRVAPVPTRTTLEICMATVRSWASPLPKSMCSKLRPMGVGVPFISLGSRRRSMGLRMVQHNGKFHHPDPTVAELNLYAGGCFQDKRGVLSWFIHLAFSKNPFTRSPQPVSRLR